MFCTTLDLTSNATSIEHQLFELLTQTSIVTCTSNDAYLKLHNCHFTHKELPMPIQHTFQVWNRAQWNGLAGIFLENLPPDVRKRLTSSITNTPPTVTYTADVNFKWPGQIIIDFPLDFWTENLPPIDGVYARNPTNHLPQYINWNQHKNHPNLLKYTGCGTQVTIGKLEGNLLPITTNGCIHFVIDMRYIHNRSSNLSLFGKAANPLPGEDVYFPARAEQAYTGYLRHNWCEFHREQTAPLPNQSQVDALYTVCTKMQDILQVRPGDSPAFSPYLHNMQTVTTLVNQLASERPKTVMQQHLNGYRQWTNPNRITHALLFMFACYPDIKEIDDFEDTAPDDFEDTAPDDFDKELQIVRHLKMAKDNFYLAQKAEEENKVIPKWKLYMNVTKALDIQRAYRAISTDDTHFYGPKQNKQHNWPLAANWTSVGRINDSARTDATMKSTWLGDIIDEADLNALAPRMYRLMCPAFVAAHDI